MAIDEENDLVSLICIVYYIRRFYDYLGFWCWTMFYAVFVPV